LDIRGKKCWEVGKDCIIRNFITCTLHQILLSDIIEGKRPY
jgi:hypothetical protein